MEGSEQPGLHIELKISGRGSINNSLGKKKNIQRNNIVYWVRTLARAGSGLFLLWTANS